ncbi:hypothetical protein ACIPL1_00975 [Pseudomonas sp. NPDC090202]|uniref:hypothetical protein n=1 Tax=unclassified Pseudomonas TaxID=196821 RepID=UPI0038009FB2
MQTFNKFFLALAFLGGSAAAQASDAYIDAARIDLIKNSRKPAGSMLPSPAKLSIASPTASTAYTSRLPSLSQGSDSYLPVQHRL